MATYRVIEVGRDGHARTTDLNGYWAETLADQLFHSAKETRKCEAAFIFVDGSDEPRARYLAVR